MGTGSPMSTRGTVLFVAMCVIWGIPYLLIRVAVTRAQPGDARLSPAPQGAALLLAASGGAPPSSSPLFDGHLRLVSFTLVEVALPWLLLSSAEQRIPELACGTSDRRGSARRCADRTHDRLA